MYIRSLMIAVERRKMQQISFYFCRQICQKPGDEQAGDSI
jgi:hypothetical protein